MIILRWLLCHLLLIIVIGSLSLGYVFRDKLKEDFNRLSGMTRQLEKDGSQTEESPKSIQKDSRFNSLYSLSKGKDQKKSLESNDEKTDDFQKNPNTQTDAGQLYNRKKKTAESNPSSSQAVKGVDPWSQDLPSKTESANSAAAESKTMSPAKASSFPPDDYVPEENGSNSVYPDSKDTIERSDQLMPASPANLDNDRMQGKAGMIIDETSVKSSAYQAALTKGRQLYWNGNTGSAQDIYEKLMFDYPEQPEAAAELGNIFLQQGKRKAASWAYQNAIPRYLYLHREQEAINLMRFISQYDPAIAESLQKKYW